MSRTRAGSTFLVLTATVALVTASYDASSAADAPPGPVRKVAAEDAVPIYPEQASGLVVRTTSGKVSSSLLTRTDALTSSTVEGTAPVATGADTIDLAAPVPLATAQALADKVADLPGVVSAEPNRIMHAYSTPPVTKKDTFFRHAFDIWDYRSSFDIAKKLPKGGWSTRAPYLWQATSGKGVVVAVIDTGITAHPDLTGRIVPGYDFLSDPKDHDGWPGRDADASDPGDYTPTTNYCPRNPGDPNTPPTASSWHGTHVTGIIAANAGNHQGVAGVAYRSRVQPIRALGPCGGDETDIADAVVWASGGTVPGAPRNPTPAKVINLSLGDSTPVCGSLFQHAVDVARSNGSVVVAAAGNASSTTSIAPVSAPGSCAGVIAVAASDEVGQRAYYSSAGGNVAIAAPGGNLYPGYSGIWSTVNIGATVPTVPGYAEERGTSMASPAVAGGAALMSSLGYSRKQIESSIRWAARTPPTYAAYPLYNCTRSVCGRGILDLAKVPAHFGSTRIKGTLAKGRKVTASSHWTGSPRLSYHWYRNGHRISHATQRTYTIRAADRGKRITVKVTGRKAHFKTLTVTSTARRAR